MGLHASGISTSILLLAARCARLNTATPTPTPLEKSKLVTSSLCVLHVLKDGKNREGFPPLFFSLWVRDFCPDMVPAPQRYFAVRLAQSKVQNSLRGQPEFLLPSLPPELPLRRLLQSPFQRCLQIPGHSTGSTVCTVRKLLLTHISPPRPASGHQTQLVIVQRDFSSLVDKEIKFSACEWLSGQCVPWCRGTRALITHGSDSGKATMPSTDSGVQK